MAEEDREVTVSYETLDAAEVARFWGQVDRSGECWEWIGPRRAKKKSRAYGTFYINGVALAASRLAWELANKRPWPDGMYACHTCDNPPCVRPDHLFPGTHRDNALDAISKGRFRYSGTDLPIQPGRCARGHDLTDPENVYLRANGQRNCRVCKSDRQRLYRRRRHECQFVSESGEKCRHGREAAAAQPGTSEPGLHRHNGESVLGCPECDPAGALIEERRAALAAADSAPPASEGLPSVGAFMDAEHRWCVQVEGDFALRHEVEAHRKQAEYIRAALADQDRVDPAPELPGLVTGRDVHAAWRDGMLAQGRYVAPERMSWETLTEQDRELDDGIAARLAAAPELPGQVERP